MHVIFLVFNFVFLILALKDFIFFEKKIMGSIARRTRSKTDQMLRQKWEENKKKDPVKDINGSPESLSFSGFSGLKGQGFSGSCEKDNGSVNFGSSVGDIDLGTFDCVEKTNMGTTNFESDGFEYLGGDDDSEDEVGVKKNGKAEVEESCSGSKTHCEDDDDVICISDDEFGEIDESSSEESLEDNDDPEDSDYEEEKSESSFDVEELSGGRSKEEDEEEEELEENQVSKREIGEIGKKGNREKVEFGLKRKRKFGIEILHDYDNCNNDDVTNGKDDFVNGGRKLNCVVKRIRSGYVSESSRKRIKLGSIRKPVCVDEEDIEDCDDDVVEIGDDDVIEIGDDKLYGSKDGNDGEHVQELHRGQPTRKRIRAYEDHEVVSILANSIFDKEEVPCVEIDEPVIDEPTLPLKFTFGTEESTPVEKSEEDKELEELWKEMAIALCDNDTTDDAPAKNEADVEVELDQAVLCSQGKHQFVLDEEIGIKCKFCLFVNLEIKYCSAPFARHPLGYSKWRDSYTGQLNIFDELWNKDSGYGLESDCDPCTNVRGTVWDIIPGIGKDLHKHQHDGFEFLWKKIAGGIHLDKLKEPASSDGETGCIISHAPGTGKTRLAIVFLQTYMKLFPTCRPVIIAPCSMLLSWEAEFKKWKVDIPFLNLNQPRLSGKENVVAVKLFKSRQLSVSCTRMVKLYSWKKDRSVLGISYKLFEELVGEDKKRSKGQSKTEDDTVRKVLLELPGLLVLDEGHTARNDNSLIWKALSNVRTEKRIILSGTPFQNNFEELYNTLYLVRPKFADRISHNKQNVFFKKRRGRQIRGARGNWVSLTRTIGKDTDNKLTERLEKVRDMIAPFVHVHRGNILQQRLPGLRDAVVILQPTHWQKIVLDKVQGTESSLNFNMEYLVSVVSVHPSLLRKQSFIVEDDSFWGRLKKLKSNPDVGVKTKFLMKLVQLSQATDEKVLVFSQFLGPLKLIGEQLESRFRWHNGKEILHMHGKVDANQRQFLIKNFNDKTSEAKVMLASTKACSEGINLVGASRVVLLDVVWNPSVERQAISRAYRLGQEKVVYIYHLITSGAMEEEKYCRQAVKDRLSELVFYSSDRSHNQDRISSCVSEDKKDQILEEMVQQDKLKDIFKKIIYQPKDSNLVNSFGVVNFSKNTN